MSDDLARLVIDLKGAGREAASKARPVVHKAANDVQAHAQAAAPVDTGYLKGSIGIDKAGNAYYAQAVIGPTAHYAPYVEYGTYKMRPQPFMGPAAAAVAPSLEAAIAQIAGEVLT